MTDSEQGTSVLSAREQMGIKLADTIRAELSANDFNSIDCIIPIPETSLTAARVCAEKLQKRLRDAFVKNRYIFRTFIMPTQTHRRTGVKRKLNAIQGEFVNRNVLLIDDSIVRGTTSQVRTCQDARARRCCILI